MEDFIINTYKVYKARESKVLNWLKEAGGQTVPFRVNQIPAIAQSIIAKGKTIPDNIIQLLSEVVTKRKEAGKWYEFRNVTDKSAGHAHIITVLEATLATLRSTKAAASRSSTPSETQPKNKTAINNLFDLLNIEDKLNQSQSSGDESSDDGGKTTDNGTNRENKKSGKKTHVKKIKSGKRKGKQRAVPKAQKASNAIAKRDNPSDFANSDSVLEYDEEDELDDFYFILYCFFKDFNHVREFLQERWCDYQDGLLSLSAVSITTNTAYELLQKAEIELYSLIPSEAHNYDFLSQMLFTQAGLAHVDYDAIDAQYANDEEGMGEAIYEEADFLCLPRYWDLIGWLKNTPPKKLAVFPKYIDFEVEYNATTAREKISRDKDILYQLLGECTLLKALHNDPSFLPPGEDEFTLGIIKMSATRHIPIWLIFACQINCDIRYILETNVTKCHDELIAMGHRVKSIMQQYQAFVSKYEILDFIESDVATTIGEVDCWILEDFCGEQRERLWTSHGFLKEQMDPNYYLRRHPLLCGMMIFRFSLTLNELGLGVSNGYGGTIAAAHLYNAVQHEIPASPKWWDMQALILIHHCGRIFWQQERPLWACNWGG